MMFEVDEIEDCWTCMYLECDTEEEPCKYCYGNNLYTKRRTKMPLDYDKVVADHDKAFARFRATHDMSCQHGLHLDGICKTCQYYYETESRVMSCLKEDIRNWTLYQIDKREEK